MFDQGDAFALCKMGNKLNIFTHYVTVISDT